jgi:phage shock protein A
MLSKRLYNLWRAVVGSGVGELEAHHAEAMLDFEREELQRKLAQYNRGLAGHAGLCEKLKADLSRLQREQQLLEPKLQARLTAGDRAGAGNHALRLQRIAEEHEHHAAQLAEAEAFYRELSRSREVALRAARDKIEALKRGIGELRVQEALADLSELTAGMQGSLGLSDGTLERIQERVQDKRNLAAGRVRVARECFETEDRETREAEQRALADAALAAYEARGAVEATK